MFISIIWPLAQNAFKVEKCCTLSNELSEAHWSLVKDLVQGLWALKSWDFEVCGLWPLLHTLFYIMMHISIKWSCYSPYSLSLLIRLKGCLCKMFLRLKFCKSFDLLDYMMPLNLWCNGFWSTESQKSIMPHIFICVWP